jgi:hypothetical protein
MERARDDQRSKRALYWGFAEPLRTRTLHPSRGSGYQPTPRRPGSCDEDDLKTVGVDERYALLFPIWVCRLHRLSTDALACLVECLNAAEVENEQRLGMWRRRVVVSAACELEVAEIVPGPGAEPFAGRGSLGSECEGRRGAARSRLLLPSVAAMRAPQTAAWIRRNRSALDVLQTDNNPRVRDGYVSLSACGHFRLTSLTDRRVRLPPSPRARGQAGSRAGRPAPQSRHRCYQF